MDNKSFWDERYTQEPWLGSGAGSRGVAAHYKAEMLRRLIAANPVRSVLDVGCGDMCWLVASGSYPGWMDGVAYTGLDISRVIVDKSAKAFPQCRFLHHDITAVPVSDSADLLICFDVLLHQVDRLPFDAALANLLAGVRQHALVSYPGEPAADPVIPVVEGFDESIERRFQGELQAARADRAIPFGRTNCFGLLPDLVGTVRPDLRIRIVGRYRFQQVYEIATADSGWLLS
ncbi:MAG: class I SAM-dependent methyltransferase [Pseudoxanthomonas sp.]|nr:class I SAM-dependent methyltransferase [Pseudoxanthomonas sp.]